MKTTTLPTKICSRCNNKKPITGYRSRPNYQYGVSCRCKDCDRAVNKETYERHSEKYRAQKRSYAKANSSQRQAYNKQWRDANPDKLKAIYQRARAKNPERFEDARLKYEYGISLADYTSMYNEQGGKCAICTETCPIGRLCVDHNHSTGKVRGLLCRTCNAAIGFLDDSVELLAKATAYVKRYE